MQNLSIKAAGLLIMTVLLFSSCQSSTQSSVTESIPEVLGECTFYDTPTSLGGFPSYSAYTTYEPYNLPVENNIITVEKSCIEDYISTTDRAFITTYYNSTNDYQAAKDFYQLAASIDPYFVENGEYEDVFYQINLNTNILESAQDNPEKHTKIFIYFDEVEILTTIVLGSTNAYYQDTSFDTATIIREVIDHYKTWLMLQESL